MVMQAKVSVQKTLTDEEAIGVAKYKERGYATGLVERVAAGVVANLIDLAIVDGNSAKRAEEAQKVAQCAVEVGLAVLAEVYRNAGVISNISDEHIDKLVADAKPKPEVTNATAKPPIHFESN